MQIEEIDIRQGTLNRYQFSHGNALPLVGVPFANNYFAVQTAGADGGWFFDPTSHQFEGLRLTHQPSPWVGDFERILFSPISGPVTSPKLVDLTGMYQPEKATFSPTYLQLFDRRHQAKLEFTPSTNGGALRVDYRKSNLPGLFLRATGPYQFHFEGQKLSGWISNFSGSEDKHLKMYLAIDFETQIDWENTGHYTSDQADSFQQQTTFSGTDLALLLRFTDNKLNLRIATSFLSEAQAQLNLSRQPDFDTMRQQAKQAWQKKFDQIEITDSQTDLVKTFYTCLYRLCLFPQRFYELDAQNQPQHYDTLAKTVKPGYLYTNNGFWDTYKTAYPLYSLLFPDELAKMLAGFLNSYRETGFLPKWLSPDERGMMPGTLIDAVIADAAVKHIGSALMPDLLDAMIKGATIQSKNPNYGRRGTEDYLKYGFVPADKHGESVNHTLDYAYSDFCISQVAATLGKEQLATKYRQSSLNYQHLFDTQTGFMRPKNTDGQFKPDFLAERWGGDYTEGSAWQNSFAVYQDIQGLIKLYGSEAAFTEKLTELCNQDPVFDVGAYGFEIHEMTEMAAIDYGQLAISNQPSFHIPYLFAYAGQSSRTQLLVKQLLTHQFNAGFEGFPGDEDNGSMAGWFILSALGFYPVTPGTGEYVYGMPLFDHVVLHLGNGANFTLTTADNQPQNNFVRQRELNGHAETRTFITQADLEAGGELTTTASVLPPAVEPNLSKPYSLSK